METYRNRNNETDRKSKMNSTTQFMCPVFFIGSQHEVPKLEPEAGNTSPINPWELAPFRRGLGRRRYHDIRADR